MNTDRSILSVSQLNRLARELIEGAFTQVWVEGEISNFSSPSSGHWYFTLKDDQAQVRCAMFANRNRMIRFAPCNGMQVILRGKASLYEGRGEYQLIAENLTPAGEGALQQRFEALKAKLAAEGLFDPAHKKPLPAMAWHIGVVTSPTGAAIRDILIVLKRRFPAIRVTILPTAVQGGEAADQIVAAIERAQQLPDNIAPLDVLLISRGGGSLEDLWPFNEERVARAIHACRIPTVVAVGHEIDFSIADFVADVRAPTPSAAAELLSPNRLDWLNAVRGLEQRLINCGRRQLQQQRQRLDALAKRLRHPGQKLQDQAQRLDGLETRLIASQRQHLKLRAATLATLTAKLAQYHPRHGIERVKAENRRLAQRLSLSVQHQLKQQRQQLAAAAHNLNTLNPLNTLARGYAIVKDEQRRIIRSGAGLTAGDKLVSYLAQDKINCTVDSVEASDLVQNTSIKPKS